MSERGMPEIVSEARGLDDFRIETVERSLGLLRSNRTLCQSAAYLRNLVSVLLAGMEDVEFTSPDNLRDARQTVKRGRVHDTIAIALECSALILPFSRIITVTALNTRRF